MDSMYWKILHADAKYHPKLEKTDIEVWFDTAEDGVISFYCTREMAETLLHNLSVVLDKLKEE